LSQNEFYCSETGDNLVLYSVKDIYGNEALTTIIVTVTDNIPLTVINPPTEIKAYALNEPDSHITYTLPMAEDNCINEGNPIDLNNFPGTPSGFTKIGIYNGHTYFISNYTETYSEFLYQIESITDAYPVSIRSAGENAFLTDYLNNNGNLSALIGYTDLLNEGSFRWYNDPFLPFLPVLPPLGGEDPFDGPPDGSFTPIEIPPFGGGEGPIIPTIYTNWSDGQPDDANGDEDVVELNAAGDGKWRDIPASTNNLRMIIEVPYAIEQTAGIANNAIAPAGITLNTFTIYDKSGNTTQFSFDLNVRKADYIYLNDSWLENKNPNGTANATETMLVVDHKATLTSAINLDSIELDENAILEVEDILKIENSLINYGELIFKSTAIKTAQFDQFTGIYEGTGIVTAERYIPSKRAFRFFSSSVTTTATIYDNLQEGGNNQTGFGTHITGNGGEINGFDTTLTNNPSAFFYNNFMENQSFSAAWTPLTNTNDQTIIAGIPIRLYVRGDRNTDLSTNSAPSSPTVLRAKGNLKIGNFVAPISGFNNNYNFVGNPYQATVDFNSLSILGDLNTNYIYVWDAQLGSAGGFVTVETADGSNMVGSDANQFIQPGQAFFVRNKLEVINPPMITFLETSKNVTEEQLAAFSNPDFEKMNLQLFAVHGENETIVDAVGFRFNENYNPAVDDDDAGKLSNAGETCALLNGTKLLSVDKRSFPNSGTEIPLFLANYKTTDYVFKNNFTNWNSSYLVSLIDNYTNTVTPIHEDFEYSFSIDNAIPESKSNLRFALLFDNDLLAFEDFEKNRLELYPNPTKGNLQIKGIKTDCELIIYDLVGKEVLADHQVQENGHVDISGLVAGVYFVMIKNGDHTQIEKIIKE